MLNLTAVFARSAKALPPRSAWIESWGFILLGFGLYLGLACLTFSPFDYVNHSLSTRGIANLGGPFGAVLSASFLGRFGIVGIIWPLSFIIWGGLTAMGFVIVPSTRRFLGFFFLTVSLAAFAQIQFPRWGMLEPVFGHGGIIGATLARPMLRGLGHGGALISVIVMAIVSMVLTGNITVSRTATFAGDSVYGLRKLMRRFWQRHVMQRDTSSHSASSSSRGLRPQEMNAAGRSPSKREESADGSGENRGTKQQRDVRVAIVEPKDQGNIEATYGLELYYDGPAHEKPNPKIFTRSEKAPPRGNDFVKIGELLTTQLAEFKVEGKVTNVVEGPVVTTFEFEPAPGTKVSKIAGLGEDLARLLSAKSLRVLAPIPGKNTVGFEVPNIERRMIGFGDLVDDDKFRQPKFSLPIAMGVDIFGTTVVEDLAEMPHLLVAGSTGSGKSVFMNTLIASLISRHTAKDLRLIMIDPKMVEMAAYNPLPHMACPVVTDAAEDAKSKLDGLVMEMEDRYHRMRAVGAKNVKSFNEIVKARRKSEFGSYEGKWQSMPYIVLIIDELADMMMVLGKEAEVPITRLAQKARAAGIHLVIATQRPSADVVTGLIKANFPTRVAFRVLSGVDSRTILDTSGAETLLGKGDMLYLSASGLRRMHGAFLNDSEVASMVRAAKARKN